MGSVTMTKSCRGSLAHPERIPLRALVTMTYWSSQWHLRHGRKVLPVDQNFRNAQFDGLDNVDCHSTAWLFEGHVGALIIRMPSGCIRLACNHPDVVNGTAWRDVCTPGAIRQDFGISACPANRSAQTSRSPGHTAACSVHTRGYSPGFLKSACPMNPSARSPLA